MTIGLAAIVTTVDGDEDFFRDAIAMFSTIKNGALPRRFPGSVNLLRETTSSWLLFWQAF
jgi:hypothetical protein